MSLCWSSEIPVCISEGFNWYYVPLVNDIENLKLGILTCLIIKVLNKGVFTVCPHKYILTRLTQCIEQL